MGEDDNFTSEWNEQKLFSSIFFNITYDCRSAQRRQDVLGWFAALETKISHVMGICKPEQGKILEIRDFLKPLHKKVMYKASSENRTNLYEALFHAESEIDTITNSHMPFLRIEDKLDIADF